jgi:hypothetical protein
MTGLAPPPASWEVDRPGNLHPVNIGAPSNKLRKMERRKFTAASVIHFPDKAPA